MVERIKTSDEVFKRAVARGDRAQIEAWDSEGLIEWNEKNFAGRQLSEEAQQRRKAEQESGNEPQDESVVSRLDHLGIGPDETLWSGHPVVQAAVRRGDSALLAELFSDPRYVRLQPSGLTGGFTRGDIETFLRRDVS